MAKGELLVDLGLLEIEGVFNLDLYADLPPLLPPSPEPSVTLVPVSSFRRASVPMSSSGRAPVSKSSPERETVPQSSQKRASVPRGSSKSPEAHKFPCSNPLLPPPLLSSGSPSAHTQPTICAVGSPWVYQSPSVLWLEDPLSPPPASESRTPPQLVDPAPPPWLLAPYSRPSGSTLVCCRPL
ncbi:hypothetical protein H4Q32_014026 [Labeo rohita]|uniref:Uncharacterized protein n=1 Tax=Labeo rohita TaxID=84645 RepID=A0ABQ8LTF5_LABRO|nr:hypothetical protein H4Q32_014026 [Labeo rohita]